MKKIYLLALVCMAMFFRGEAQTTLLSGTGDGGFETGTDFASNGWTLVSTTTNNWWLGTAGGAVSGRAAFVGTDASTNAYNNSSRTCHFYRDILVPGGSTSLTLTFSLKGNGEVGWDRLLVYTAPVTITPAANVPASNSTTLTGATLVYTQTAFLSSFTTQTVSLPSSLAGTTFRLIFTWQNDGSGRTNPPATVDNINFTVVCPTAGAFTASATPSTLCPGSSLSLTSSLGGGTSYSWTGPAGSGYTSALRNPAAFAVTAASGGVYTVSANMGACGTYTATTSVTVNPAPSVSISPTSSCSPPVTLTTTVGGSSSYTYSWSPSTGLSSSTVASPSSNPSSTQNYTLTVTAANTCTNTATASVGPAPSISISPAGPVCGRTITASGAGTGGTYSWSPAAGLSATTGATVVATPSVTTTYTVTGITTAGCIGTQTITVLATPTASLGYTFSCTAPSLAVTSNIGSGESISTYAWTPTAGLSSTTSSSVILPPGTTATYTVLVTATNSCTSTATYAFTAVSPTVFVSPTSSSLCLGGAGITLTASGATTYTWTTSAGLSATTGAVVVASPTITTTYTVTGTNGVGCSNIATSAITVSVQSVPYTENFDAAAALPCGWSISDVNADSYSWVIGTPGGSPTGYSSPNLAKYVYNSTTTTIAANDWLFTKGLSLNANTTYNLTFKYGARSGSFPEGLEVKWGSAPSVAGMTSATLFSNTAIASPTMASSGTISLTTTSAGVYYIGFHAISAANEWELYMDDFSIIVAPAVVTSSPTSLSFGLVSVGSTSASQNITLTASYLTSGGSLTISAPANFQVYNGTSWVSSFNYTYTGTSISGYVVPVQFNPTASTAYSAAITISGGGLASAASITVSGTGVGDCSGTPATPTATASNTTLCNGSATTLSVPLVIATGITYQWYVSPDNTTFNPISGATNNTYSTGISATRYYRCLETCTLSSLVATSNTVTITGGVNYASIPFTEDFEATWVNLCGTKDVPNLYWKNTPSTSDSSWRREDDAPGANTAGWTSVSSYLYSPVFSTTAHSARFHSGRVSAGRRGIMDLYVDLSGAAGIKPVTYDVINTSGSDYLDVYVSTDGGLTFSSTMDHFTTATSWSSRSFNINSNSATVVVRFVATADFGSTDIGIDNIKISNPCTGTPTAGTVTGSSVTATASAPSVLTLSGTTPGVTYQWVQRVPAVSGATSLISGATSATYSANPSVATSYYCVVTCGGSGLSATTNEVTVYHIDCFPVYDASASSYTAYAHMTQFALNGYSGSSMSDVLPSSTFNTTANYVFRGSAVTAVNLQQGNSYPVTVTYSTGDVAVSNEIWIDYNDNGIFEASEAAVPVFGYSTSTTTSATANIYIPGSATVGTHLMRVRNSSLDYITQPTAMDPCLNVFGGNQYFVGGTADYLVTIVAGTACSAAPTAGTVSSSVAYAGATSVINLTLSGFSTATGISFQWQKRTTSPVGSWTNISGATSPTYTTVGQTASTDYQCVVTCAGSGLTATSLNFVTITYLIDPTCTSVYTNASDGTTYPLAAFQLLGYNGTSINNTIPGYTYLTTGSYADQTGTVAPVTMQQGSTGAVTLTYAGSRARQETTIWIDFNDNGTFENSENVSGIMINPTSYTTAATGTTGTVTIPATAALGPHRMRVRQAFSAGASSPSTTMNPCTGSDATNTYSYGVTTDFIVIIVKPVITATGGSFAFGSVVDGQVSAGTSFTITGTNLNPATGGSITLTASTGFKVSLDGSTYATTVTVPYLTSTLPATTVYARFAPVSPANGAITGNIVVSGGGAVTTITPLTGTAYDSKITVTGTLAGFGDVYVGSASAPQSYTVSAANLYPATDTVRITAPANFSISTSSGSGYTNSLAFPVSGGSLSAQTIYVECTPGSTALGALSGNIVNSDANGAAANQLVAVSGNGVTQTLTVSDTTLSAGAVTIGGSASPVSFNLSGTYLTGYPGNITATSSDPQYLLSLSSGGTYTSSVSVPFTAATMASVPVYVKFTPSATGASSTTVTFSGGGVSVPPTVVVHGSGANYCGVPTGQPTATSAYSPTSTGATVSVTPFSTAPDGYLLIQTTAPAAFTGSLTDGTTYTVGSTIGGGLVLGYFTTTPPFSVTGLPSNTINNITVIPYNSSAACSGSPYYLTAGALSSQVTTCPAAPDVPSATSITSSGFRIQWTAPAGGATGYLVNVYKAGVAIAGSPFSTASLYYDVAGLDMNTGYTFTVIATNAVCAGPASAAGSATTSCANPTVVVSPTSSSTCASTNTNLVASGAGVGGTYAWTPATNLTSTTAASVVANPATSTVYTVTGTNAFGCSSTATASINVVSGISAINVAPASASNCSGVATTLTATVVGASTTLMSNNFSSGGSGSLNSWTVTNYPWGSTTSPDPWAVHPSGFNPGAGWGGGAMTGAPYFAFSFAYSNRVASILTSTSFSLAGLVAANLSFSHFFKYFTGTPYDTVAAVQLSTDGGSTWTTLHDYVADGVSAGTNSSFAAANLSLTSYISPAATNCKVRFIFRSFGYGWAVANVAVTGAAVSSTNPTWAPTAGLYTDAALTTAYTGDARSVVYAAPASNTTYSASVGSCGLSGSSAITVNPSPLTYNVTPTGSPAFCGSAVLGVDNSQSGLNYKLMRGTTLVNTIAGGGSSIDFGTQSTPGVYSIVALNTSTGCNTTMTGNVTVNAIPSISLGSVPYICQGITTVPVAYASPSGTPTTYSIDWNSAANAAGITDVSGAALSGGTIPLAIPATGAVGSFDGTVTVSNGSCISSGYNAHIIVYATPAVTLSAVNVPCYNHVGSIDFTGVDSATVNYTVDGGPVNHFTFSGTTYSLSTGTLTAPHSYDIISASNPVCATTYHDTITVTPTPMTWIGGTAGHETDWNTATNWTCGFVPTATDSVTIPGTLYAPVLPGSVSATVGDLDVAAGTVVNLNSGALLNVTGDINNSGTVAGNGRVVINGSSAQKIKGIGTISNVELNNASGATIQPASRMMISNAVYLTAGTLTTNDSLELLSTDTFAAARIAEIPSTGAGISGRVKTDQYVQGGYRRFRFWGHSFSETISLSQLTPYIDITGPGGSSNGFTTTTTNNPSAFRYDPYIGNDTSSYSSGWIPFTRINASAADSNRLHPGQGIRLFFRGSKGEGLGYLGYLGMYTPSSTINKMIGHVNQGAVSIPLKRGTDNQTYNQLSNPYPSPVDIGTVLYNAKAAGQVTGGAFYVWNPSIGAGGQYMAIPIGTSAPEPYYLQANTSFQVRADHDGAHIDFVESDKVANASLNLFRALSQAVRFNIYDTTYHLWDVLSMQFNDKASDNEDKQLDATKPYGPDLNFYSISKDGSKLAIDARTYEGDKVVPLGVKSAYQQDFVIRAESISVPTGGAVTLHDKLLNKYVDMKEGTEYRFTIGKDKSTQGDERFELVLKPTTAAAVKGLEVSMAPNPASDDVKITFTSGSKDNVSVRIMDVSGVSIYSQDLGAKQNGVITVPMSNFAAGVYMVEITQGGKTVTQRLVKE